MRVVLARRILRFVGIACIVFAMIGLFFSSFTSLIFFSAGFSDNLEDPEIPYFLHAFTIMCLINVVCYCALAYLGVQLLRLKTRLYPFLTGVLVFEVIYFFSIGFFGWTYSAREVARSIAAATGIANGGLIPQFITLFPLWGALLASWASKELISHQQRAETARAPDGSAGPE